MKLQLRPSAAVASTKRTRLVFVLSLIASIIVGLILVHGSADRALPGLWLLICGLCFVPMLLHFIFPELVGPKLTWPWIGSLLLGVGSLAWVLAPCLKHWSFIFACSAVWFTALLIIDEVIFTTEEWPE
jgi:hypothetical protein